MQTCTRPSTHACARGPHAQGPSAPASSSCCSNFSFRAHVSAGALSIMVSRNENCQQIRSGIHHTHTHTHTCPALSSKLAQHHSSLCKLAQHHSIRGVLRSSEFFSFFPPEKQGTAGESRRRKWRQGHPGACSCPVGRRERRQQRGAARVTAARVTPRSSGRGAPSV